MTHRIALISSIVSLLISTGVHQVALAQSTGDPVSYERTSPAPAHSSQSIDAILVSGNKRVEEATIKSFLGIKVGDAVDNQRINEALASIYNTDLFADVRITLDGDTLNVIVTENPIIANVAFEGNKRIEDDTLRDEVKLAPRAIYTKKDLQRDVKRILDVYQRSGRFSAAVVPKVIQLDNNRVNVVFEIDEGQRSKIGRISFVGNHAFGSDRLRRIIQTKETRWYRFFSGDDTYDPDRMAFDQELLRRHYVANGYADFRVLSSSAELSPSGEEFFITYTLDEGQEYQFGKMQVENRLANLADGQLEALLLTHDGEIFNAELVEQSVEAITKELGDLGYAFVEIDPQYQRDVANQTIGLQYVIKEGPRVYIDQINIAGNVRTLDQVIRREFRIAEGDPYNATKLKRSQQRIRNLGYFKNVDISTSKGTANDRLDIDVDVEEQSTGELSFGAGFSTSDGALGDVSITERNLLGKGQFLKLNFQMASVRQQVDLSFTEPYFMGRDVNAGFDVFHTRQDGSASRSNRAYDNQSTGGVLRASYPVTEHLTHALRYSLRNDEITDIDPTASLFIQRQEGENTTSLVGQSLIYDKRDSRIEPTEGYMLRYNLDVAGLGGDARFVRNELRGTYYYPVYDRDWILKVGGMGGHVAGYGSKDVRINDRFFIGSNEVRGFDSDGIGPRDETTGDALGGNIYLASTLELTFPLGLPEELGFRGAIFGDAGTLFDTDDKDTLNQNGVFSRVLDDSSVRASVGVGIAWRSPLGPIRIDYAEPLAKESYDDLERIRFSFGTRF